MGMKEPDRPVAWNLFKKRSSLGISIHSAFCFLSFSFNFPHDTSTVISAIHSFVHYRCRRLQRGGQCPKSQSPLRCRILDQIERRRFISPQAITRTWVSRGRISKARGSRIAMRQVVGKIDSSMVLLQRRELQSGRCKLSLFWNYAEADWG